LPGDFPGLKLTSMKNHAAIRFALWSFTWIAFARTVSSTAASEEPLSGMVTAVTNLWRQQVATTSTVTLTSSISAKYFLFCQTEWTLKAGDQSFSVTMRRRQEQMKLPEAERLKVMNRFDDYTEMWFVRLAEYPNANAALKAVIHPSPKTNQYHREVAYLGNRHGYACYAFMPIYEWVGTQKTLDCLGGDAPLPAMIRGLGVVDRGSMTANSCSGMLSAAGSLAVPYLKPLLSTINAPLAIRTLSNNQSKESTELLLECTRSPSPEVARAAKHYLCAQPRAEAVELYFQWLAQDAGRTNTLPLLRACTQFDQARLAPHLPRVLASPDNPRELRLAFDLSRSIAGHEIPPSLTNAETVIRQSSSRATNSPTRQEYDQAVAVLTQSNDVEASAYIGMSLATASGKGLPNEVNQAGVLILKTLPDQRGVKLARLLCTSCRDENVHRALREVIE
jgi:hypothetical protein